MAKHQKDWNLLSANFHGSIVNEFNSFDEVDAKFLYTEILKAVKEAISDDKIDCLMHLSNLLSKIQKDKCDQCLKNYQTNDGIGNFNLITLACMNKARRVLEYIFTDKSQTLYNLSVKLTEVYENKLLLSAMDEFRHNAFYYAIRSNITDLLSILVDKAQIHFSNEELDDLLSKSYKELKLRNVSLMQGMHLFVERKIFDLRFFHVSTDGKNGTGNSLDQIKKRIELVVKYIQTVTNEYRDKDPDERFIFIGEFIAKNIHVLKSLLRSTYDRLPWEEIEFCLIIFLKCCKNSSDLNLVYNCVLNKKQLLMHLFNFLIVLNKQCDAFENNDVIKLAKTVRLPRDCVVEKIIEGHGELRELYNDYETIRDFYSLEIIKSYADMIESSDAAKKRKHLLVSRVLQVLGEHLKNTLDSPKLSTKTLNTLLYSLSSNTREVVTKLRDSLSHEETLLIRSETEKKSYLFKNMLTDISRIQAIIPGILYKLGISSVKILMKKVNLCKSLEDIQECYGPYRHSLSLYSGQIENTNLMKGDFERLEESLKCLDKYIKDKTVSENLLFENVRNLIWEEKETFDLLKEIFISKVSSISELKRYGSGQNHSWESIRSRYDVFEDTDLLLNKHSNVTKRIREQFLELSNIVLKKGRLKNREYIDIIEQIWVFLGLEFGSVKWIEEFRDTVCLKSGKNERHRKLRHNLYENLLTSKILQLKEELVDFDLTNASSSDDVLSFKSNAELRAVTEMLVLDILCILETSCSRNPFFLDSDFPVIIGKNLRNHLAHGNTLIDVCFQESYAQLLVNAKKLLTVDITKLDKEIDKVIMCDYVKLESSFEEDLRIMTNQRKLFDSLEAGNMKDVEECMKEGADVYGKDFNSSTCLHFSAKAPDIAALKWLLKKGLDIYSKDRVGQTVLHIAAKYNRIDVIRYLVERQNMPLDVNDANCKTPSNLTGKIPDTVILKWNLKQFLCVDSNKPAGEIVSHIATELNRREEILDFVKKELMSLLVCDVDGKTPLHVAVENRSNEVVEYISELEICTTVQAKNGFTPLHTAICMHNNNAAEILLKKEENVDEIKANKDSSALHMAALQGNLHLVELLLSKKASVFSKTDLGDTPLHEAVFSGHIGVVKALVENGAEVNTKNEGGITPLMFAAMIGSMEIVEFLLQHGADFNDSDNRQKTPLEMAAINGNATVLELLLQKGAHVNSKDDIGYTPLHYSAFKGHCEIIKLLLNHKATIDCRANEKETPLYVSIINGQTETVKLLLKEGAVLNATYLTNPTLLHAAVVCGHLDMVDVLIDEGVDVNFKNENGTTALHLAASMADRAMVKSLLKKGADIRAINAKNVTPLFLLISNGLSDVLTPESRDVNSADDNGFTLLLAAASAGDQTLVEYCIENGCDINARNISGSTAMHLAAFKNHSNVASLLLSNGAEIDAKDGNGKTPLKIAAENNCKEMVTILGFHDANYFISKTDDKIKALEISVACGYSEIVDILLQNYKFDIDEEQKQNLLSAAVTCNHKHVVATLLERGCQLNGDAGHLHIAVLRRCYSTVEFLLSKGANPNILNGDNFSPLDIAVHLGDEDMFEILVSEKADIPIKSEATFSATEIAVGRNQLNIIQLLLQMKLINVHFRGSNGFTWLHISALSGSLDVTKYFVAHGVNLNAKDVEEHKPVHLAAYKGFKDLVEFYLTCSDLGNELAELLNIAAGSGNANLCEFLLERNSDMDKIPLNYATPMYLALSNDHKDVLSLLLHYGAYYNTPQLGSLMKTPKDNDTASSLRKIKMLFTAVQNNVPSKVENLLKEISGSKYCLPNAKCVRKENVLHYACWKGHEKIVDILLNYNTNPNTQTQTGETPLHYAAKFSQFRILKSLLSNGGIYNNLSKTGKIPLDYASDRKVRDLLLTLRFFFKKVQDKDLSVLENLKGQDKGIMRAIIRAKNREGKTLIDVAYICGFSKIEELLELFKTDIGHDLLSAARYLFSTERYAEAKLKFESLLSKKVSIFGAESHPVLDTRFYIALILEKQGKLDEALELYREVQESRKKILGENHFSTQLEELGIANLLSIQGKRLEALRIFEATRIKLKENFDHLTWTGLEGLDGLTSINNENHVGLILLSIENTISNALFQMGKFDDALKLNYEIQQKCGKKKEYKFRVHLANSLYLTAMILMKRDKLLEALKLFAKAYELRRDIYTPHDPGTLRAMKLFAKTYEIRRDIFTPHDKSTLRALSKVAYILFRLGLVGECLKIVEEVLDVQKSLLPENDYDVLETECHVGEIFCRQEKFLTARKILLPLEQKIIVVAPNSDLMKAYNDLIGIIKRELSWVGWKFN